MKSYRLQRLRLFWPTVRLAWGYLHNGDPWQSLPSDVPMPMFGEGNLAADFRCYIQGPSRVRVRSVRDVCAWLRRCKYQSDSRLFGRRDYWQYPAGFEELRRGDCEDHALWAWSKLIQLGHEAELVIGRYDRDEPDRDWHAWVVYAHNDCRFLLEAASKSECEMLQPWAEVSSRYWPHFSVDQRLQRHMYAGHVGWVFANVRRRQAPIAAGVPASLQSGNAPF